MRQVTAFSLLAACSISCALAAEGAASGSGRELLGELEEVTISASSISIAGYQQPTPVQSLDITALQDSGKTDLTDMLRAMPAFAGSSSPQNTKNSVSFSQGNAGLNLVNLRGLGINRTLVLIDGQRIVFGSLNGGVDTNNIPTSLVKRVDVVTGGASAIWGSDAVAGVVNYILDKEFTGVEVNLTTENNWEHAHAMNKIDLTAGTPFAGGRGHIEGALSHTNAPDTYFNYQQGPNAITRYQKNPACDGVTAANGTRNDYGYYCPPGEVWLIPAVGPGNANATPGGLITGCFDAAGVAIAGCALNNIMFVGPNAEPRPFIPGVVTQAYVYGGTENNRQSYFPIKGSPQKTTTAFALGTYDITDRMRLTAQFNWGYTGVWGNTYMATQNDARIATGNPFIPESIQDQMTALGISTLRVGTLHTNPFTGPIDRVQDLYGSLGGSLMYLGRRLSRGVLGLNGEFGDSTWKWDTYYTRSQTKTYQSGRNNQHIPSRTLALNAVRVGSYTPTYSAATHPNPLGLATGTITCLSNLLPVGAAGRTTDCAPLNIFGEGPGVASQEAIDYIQRIANSDGDSTVNTMTQDAASFSVQGLLPWGFSAGRVAMAAGLSYRKEVAVKTNCGEPCNSVTFPYGNFSTLDAQDAMREISVEFNAPLLKDSFVQDLSVGLAYRGVDYDTSGFVSTYKVGFLSQINDLIRLRASYSRDIRAANLVDLFGRPTTDGTSVRDPRTGITNPMFIIRQGNPNLVPESSQTSTAGIVLTPFRGLTASLDWYRISIKDVINSGLPVSVIVAQCVAGDSASCANIYYGDYPRTYCSSTDINGCALSLPLFGVVSQALNADRMSTEGVDFVGSYTTPFMNGTLNFNADANFVFNQMFTTRGNTCNVANSMSAARSTYPGCTLEGNPKFRGNLGVGYAQGPWRGSVNARMVGAAHIVSRWESGVQVPNNDIPFTTYFDARLSYKFEPLGLTIYGALDNVLNQELRATPVTPYTGPTLGDINLRDDIYDGYGRVWRVGVRMRF